MSVFKSVFNAALLICTVGMTSGCVEDPDPLEPPNACNAGDTRDADDGCNTCTCDADGNWACTEIGCEQPCGEGELSVDGECRTGCYGEQECGDDERCNAAEVCYGPPGADGADVAPAVCYGYCVPDEPVDCPAIGCAIACEHGFVQDENGCDTCECAPPPACEPVLCEIACEFGFQQDEDGCDICACAPPPMCEPVETCDIDCEGAGIYIDENGCEFCGCGPICEPVACDLYCEHGYVQDENGCEMCACAEPPLCDAPEGPHYYVGNSVEECTMIDFICAEGTDYFANECGCGCVGAQCFPGDRRDAEDGCNTCECTEDGFWACTEIACPEECPEGQFFQDGACRVGCYGEQDCGGGACNAAEICLPPPAEGDAPDEAPGAGAPQPAVCYGYCIDG
jgi:hypothetical protein